MAPIGGIVKAVLSGDTIVLKSTKNPLSEKTVCLAWVSTPFMRRDNEEPFAFEAREFLRKNLVGKNVLFRSFYQVPNTNKDFGIVTAPDGTEFPQAIVKAGLAKVRKEDNGRSSDDDITTEKIAELRKLESEARDAKRGQWSGSNGVITVQHDLGDPAAFLDTYKGKTLEGTVERVLSGDRLLIRLQL